MTLGNIGRVYDSLGQYAKALEYHQKSLEIKRSTGDVQGEGVTLSNIGVVYRILGDNAKALEYQERSLEIRRKVGDIKGEGVTLNNIGKVYESLGQYAKALEYHEKSLEIERTIGNTLGEGATLNNIGKVYESLGQYAKAREYYEKSLEMRRQTSDVQGEGVTLCNIGVLYLSYGLSEKAIELCTHSLAIQRRIGDRNGETYSLMALGVAHQAAGRSDQALECYQQAMAICKEMGTKFDQLNNAIGFLYLDQGDIPTAELYIKQAGSRSLLGLLALKRGDFQVALAEYENVLHQAKESGRAAQLFAAWTGLGKVYEALNDYEKAGQHYAEAVKLVEDLQSNLGPSERQAFLSVKVQGFNRSEPAEGLARLRLKERQSPVDVVLPPTLPQLHHEATP